MTISEVRKINRDRTRQSNFGCRAVNDPKHSRSGAVTCKFKEHCSRCAALQKTELAVQRLSWCGFVVRQNFSNRRGKVFDAGTGHDDAVAPALSFLRDAQESSTVV